MNHLSTVCPAPNPSVTADAPSAWLRAHRECHRRLAQQQRMSVIMAKQDEVNRRFEKVIERWEGQAGAKP
jgi:hypothetical protein